MVKLIPLILLSLFIISCSTNTESLYEKGLIALKNKDNEKALKFFHRACKYENFKSCNKIADIYKKGQIVIIDYTKVDEYYTDSYNFSLKQCNSKSIEACRNLSYLYEFGLGVDIDYAKSDEYTLKTCNIGDGYSCHKMGKINNKDIKEYIRFTDMACSLKYPAGCSDLGNMYINGYNNANINVNKKIDLALKYFDAACNLSDPTCALLGDIYIAGQDIPQNYELANKYYNISEKYYKEQCKDMNDKDMIDKNTNNKNLKYKNIDDKVRNHMACLSLDIIRNKTIDLQ